MYCVTTSATSTNMNGMTMCYACQGEIKDDEDRLRCKMASCSNIFHLACTSTTARSMSKEDNDEWVCPECRISMKKGGDNSLTPVGSSKMRSAAVTSRNKVIKPPANEDYRSIEYLEINAEIRKLHQEVADISAMLKNVLESVTGFGSKMDTVISRTQLVESKLETLGGRAQNAVQSQTSATNQKSNPSESKAESCSGSTFASKAAEKQMILGAKMVSIRPEIEGKRVRTTSSAQVIPSQQQRNEESFEAPQKTNTADEPEDGEGWIEVRKKSRRPQSMCCLAGPSVTTLQAVERRRYFHLWNMRSGLEEVQAYLQQVCAPESGTVDALKPKGDYKSYKIGVPADLYDKCFSVNMWPDNARVKPWIPFRGGWPKTNSRK